MSMALFQSVMNKDIKFMKIAPLGILTISENKKLNSKVVKKHPENLYIQLSLIFLKTLICFN